MSKSNTHENDYLKLVYNATAIANLADNASSSPATNITVHFHVADPGEAGITTTSECTYTGYAAATVARTAGGWTVTGNVVNPAAVILAGACTGGSNTVTHFSTSLAGGSTVILHSGTVTPNITVTNGVTPKLETTTNITED
jgi:hypothetical protein